MIAGQLSDSSCGTLKRLLKNDLKSGKGKMHIRDIFHQLKLFSVMFLNTAEKIVNYCSDQPDLREVNQSRFLKSKTMSRKYYHMTKTLVEEGNKEKHAKQEVLRLVGKLPDMFTATLISGYYSQVFLRSNRRGVRVLSTSCLSDTTHAAASHVCCRILTSVISR